MTQEQQPTKSNMEMFSGNTYEVNEEGLAVDTAGMKAQLEKRQAAYDLALAYQEDEASEGDEERAARDVKQAKEALDQVKENSEKLAYLEGTENIVTALESEESDLSNVINHAEAEIEDLTNIKDQARIDSVVAILDSTIEEATKRLKDSKEKQVALQTELTVAKLYLEIQKAGGFNKKFLEAVRELADNGTDFSSLKVGEDLLKDLDNYYLSFKGAATELVHMYKIHDENNDEKHSKRDSYLDTEISKMESILREAGINVDNRDEVKRISELTQNKEVKEDIILEVEDADLRKKVTEEETIDSFVDVFKKEVIEDKVSASDLLVRLKTGVTPELIEEFDSLEEASESFEKDLKEQELSDEEREELQQLFEEFDDILVDCFDIIDAEKNKIYISGAIPGRKGTLLEIRG